MRRITALLTLLCFISACAHPEVVGVQQPQDQSMSCQQIQQEIARSDQLRQQARAEDRFKWQYILIVPAAYSLWQMQRAETAADSRREHLLNIYAQKGCSRAGPGAFYPGVSDPMQPQPAPYGMEQGTMPAVPIAPVETMQRMPEMNPPQQMPQNPYANPYGGGYPAYPQEQPQQQPPSYPAYPAPYGAGGGYPPPSPMPGGSVFAPTSSEGI